MSLIDKKEVRKLMMEGNLYRKQPQWLISILNLLVKRQIR